MRHSWVAASLEIVSRSSIFFSCLSSLHETVFMKTIMGYSFLDIVSSKQIFVNLTESTCKSVCWRGV